jgi:hypothetical protein
MGRVGVDHPCFRLKATMNASAIFADAAKSEALEVSVST